MLLLNTYSMSPPDQGAILNVVFNCILYPLLEEFFLEEVCFFTWINMMFFLGKSILTSWSVLFFRFVIFGIGMLLTPYWYFFHR